MTARPTSRSLAERATTPGSTIGLPSRQEPKLRPLPSEPWSSRAAAVPFFSLPGNRAGRPEAAVLAALETPALGQGALPDPTRDVRSIPRSRWRRSVLRSSATAGAGGSPTDPRNLWPEPRVSADGWNADLKDELEAVLARMICSGRVPLAEAQRAIVTDWIAAYRRYVTGAQ